MRKIHFINLFPHLLKTKLLDVQVIFFVIFKLLKYFFLKRWKKYRKLLLNKTPLKAPNVPYERIRWPHTFLPCCLAQSATPACSPSSCARTRPVWIHRGSVVLRVTWRRVHSSCLLQHHTQSQHTHTEQTQDTHTQRRATLTPWSASRPPGFWDSGSAAGTCWCNDPKSA